MGCLDLSTMFFEVLLIVLLREESFTHEIPEPGIEVVVLLPPFAFFV